MSLKHPDIESEVVDTVDTSVDNPTIASDLVDLWARDYLARPGIVAALLVLFIGYITYRLFLGPVPSTIFGNDVVLLLDGGWRILNGLVPNHDFYLSLGPVTYMWVAAGLWITHGSAAGLSVGLTAFAALVTVFAFLVARTRMTSAGTILYSAYILLLCTGPMPLGRNPSTDLTYAMIYNRFGYALLSILYVALLLTPKRLREHQGREDWFAWTTAGVSLAVLFFLKVSFFGIGVALAAFVVLGDRKGLRRLLPLAAGLGAFSLAMLAFLRFDVFALVRDLLGTVAARSRLASHFGITDMLELTPVSFLGLCLVVGLLGESKRRDRLFLLGGAAFTLGAEFLFVRMDASQGNHYPLCIIFLFILLEYVWRSLKTTRYHAATFAGSVLIIALSFMVPTYYVELRSLALLVHYKTDNSLKAAGYRIEGEQLKNLLFYDFDGDALGRPENGHFFTSYVNDGINLLKKDSNADDIIASLSFDNPFPYALLRRPPRGGSTWFLLGNNIAANNMPSDQRMFGDATVVMVPKPQENTHSYTDNFLASYYKPYLRSHFTLVAASGQWTLYRRLPGQ